jgi:hypothetical protein
MRRPWLIFRPPPQEYLLVEPPALAFQEIAPQEKQQTAAHKKERAVEQGPERIEIARQHPQGEEAESLVDQGPVAGMQTGIHQPDHAGEIGQVEEQRQRPAPRRGSEQVDGQERRHRRQ